jgi:hypothetical protein
VPRITGLTGYLDVSAATTGTTFADTVEISRQLPPTGGSVTFDMPAPPANLSPAGDNTVSYATSFSWTPISNGIYIALVNAPASSPTITFVVLTNNSSFNLPDVRALDASYALPTSTNCNWGVFGFSDAVTPPTVESLLNQPLAVIAGPSGNQVKSVTDTRKFTTAPSF